MGTLMAVLCLFSSFEKWLLHKHSQERLIYDNFPGVIISIYLDNSYQIKSSISYTVSGNTQLVQPLWRAVWEIP